MADIIADLEAPPEAPRMPRLPPGIHDGVLVARGGIRYLLVADDLSPREAARHAAAGAEVVFDECGCGGTCGLEWLSAERAASLARSEPALLTRKGHTRSLSLWQSGSGTQVVLAQGPVAWSP